MTNYGDKDREHYAKVVGTPPIDPNDPFGYGEIPEDCAESTEKRQLVLDRLVKDSAKMAKINAEPKLHQFDNSLAIKQINTLISRTNTPNAGAVKIYAEAAKSIADAMVAVNSIGLGLVKK